uniref:NYN domain-containing protein n=1 Tax=Thermosporothrix sp. COM3 TaxID=2490863 RepID=A0A455SXM2_9CHLR|nr:hypothetical protein KTC_46450 [Thermosporothrix sp. COM3]
MTTHNTDHEHNDVDAAVAQHPSVPESTIDSTASENETPAAVEAKDPSAEQPAEEEKTKHAAASSVTEVANGATETTEEATTASTEESTQQHSDQQESPADIEPKEQVTEEAPSSEAETEQQPEKSTEEQPVAVTTTHESQAEEPAVVSAQPETEKEQKPEQKEQEISPAPVAAQEPEKSADMKKENETKQEEEGSAAFALPLVDAEENVIRPFTAFIEEFQQAEAQARIQASLKESQLDTFSLLSPTPETPFIEVKEEEQPSTQEAPKEEQAPEVQAAEASPQTEEQPVSQAAEAQPEEQPAAAPERAVSPLLRPASRSRSRNRHHREEKEAKETKEPVVEKAETEQPTEVQPAPVAPAEPEQPRPARRYRFDRPAATSNPTTPAAAANPPTSQVARNEETKEARATRTETPTEQAPQAKATAHSTTPEQQPTTTTKSQGQETAENASPTTTKAEHSRRRSQERQKEAAPATPPASEVVPPMTELSRHVEEIAPEDLPPLEYSELQKTSRRRRRHRSSASNNGTAAASSTETPTQPQQNQPTSSRPSPTLPAGSGLSYSIVSGYTVNQMNQGNDLAGPFMAPEPSPARGSVFSRDGRTTRAELLRPQIYPGGSTSSSTGRSTQHQQQEQMNTAALNHLANTIVQAFQLQTDRMVAELRRQAQAPTNVSVSLPPFPSNERVGVFVDVANLLYSARTLRLSVDFGKLLDFLRGNRRLVRAHAYCPTSPQQGDEQMFLQAVKGLGYRITTKNYKTFSSGAKKADLDLDLCMDVVRLVEGKAVDCVVLVSGDSDFMPMLDYCSDHGVRVEVAAFDEAMSATLRQSCDLFINLSMLEEIRS